MFELGKKDEDGISRDETGQPAGQSAYRETERQAPSPSRASGSGGVAAIGRSIRINGDLEGEEDLRIDGQVTGTVRLKKNAVIIGQDGKIKADVYAKSVAVDGEVEGDLYGAEQVSIRQSATVKGNVTAPRVSLEDGASFKGSIEMDPDAVREALGDAAVDPVKRQKASRSSAKATAIAAKANGDARHDEGDSARAAEA